MKDYTHYFESFDGHSWFNVASEGPLPKAAAQALQEAVMWKSKVYQLTLDKFIKAPLELKQSLERLLNLSSREFSVSNSASYGIHILADGIPFQPGDEILLMQNDFPTNILPWLACEDKGVKVRQVKPQKTILSVEELEQAISTRTRLVCLSHVHSFSGDRLDVEPMMDRCRERGILFVLNVSQTAGVLPLDLSTFKADAIVCAGYKWLLGPYGTGFCWISSALRETLTNNRAYWASSLSPQELEGEGELVRKVSNSARRFDQFGTANFFNFVPFKVSIDVLLEIGLDNVWGHNQKLVQQFYESVGGLPIEILTTRDKNLPSPIIVFSHQDASRNTSLQEALAQQGIHLALWKNKLRFSPHIYNTTQEVEAFTANLKKLCV